jgi:hypothetical protein
MCAMVQSVPEHQEAPTDFAECPTGEVRRIPKMRSSENAVPFSHMTSLGTIAQPSYCSLTHTLLAYWRKL